jgi:glutamine---fructose-6-phosphate transaminase (isomerizing)
LKRSLRHLPQVRGAFALAFLFEGEENLLIGARRGSPLAIGFGTGEMYIGSDAIALAPFTDQIAYLEEGDLADRDASGRRGARRTRQARRAADADFECRRFPGRQGQPSPLHGQGNLRAARSGRRIRSPYIDMTRECVRLPFDLPFDFNELDRMTISACGTAFYAGTVAKYWFERLARLPVEIDIASEFRYREAPLDEARPR